MGSLRAFLDAVSELVATLTAVRPLPLAAALVCALANHALRARAWQGVLRAAVPEAPPDYGTVLGSYVAGVGVNAALPARGGDLVRIFLVHRRDPTASYPTLAGSLVAETALDWVVSGAFLLWALQAGVLPGLPRLPRLPAFDLSWIARNPIITLAALVGAVLIVVLAGRHVRGFWRRFGQGMVILHQPGRYVRWVVPYQLAAWCLRIGAAYLFLAAFGVPATLGNALVVQVAGSLSSLFPATPGGLGPNQALLVVMLAGEAGRSAVLAFSVGMELALTAMNVTLGLIALAVVSGGLGLRGAIAHARARAAAHSR